IGEQIGDIILPVKPIREKMTEEYKALLEKDGFSVDSESRPMKIFKMRLPEAGINENRIPYIVLQYLTGIDGNSDSECKVRLIAGTYSEDGESGSMDLLNVLTRIRVALLRKGQAGDFLLRRPLETIVYPDNVNPYYYGEMLLTFELPEITREVEFYQELCESEENNYV
ncbi:MAG: hypothetical protein FWF82_03650, partial [Oscillospiraceae bacterium]|nr:hypothetical protein [Oscillospiraceae bacterium]